MLNMAAKFAPHFTVVSGTRDDFGDGSGNFFGGKILHSGFQFGLRRGGQFGDMVAPRDWDVSDDP